MATHQLTIPMFPLNIVLLPGETQTIHIFEERYKQLVQDCTDNQAHFGIPFVNSKKIGDYGIEVKIISVIKQQPNGEMDIVIEGLKVFKMVEFSSVLTPKLYGAGIIAYEDEMTHKPSVFLQDLTKEYMWISQQRAIPLDAFDNANIYTVARLIELSSAEKYELIKAENPIDKERFLTPKIKLFIHLNKFVLN
jgi:Lon protease-like protein